MTDTTTLVDFVRLNKRRHPSDTAVVDDHRRFDHATFSDRVHALARGLRDQGLSKGDHVGILAGNSIFTAEAFLGVLCAGGVAVMYNWRWAPTELEHGITSTDAEIVLVETEFADTYSLVSDRLDGVRAIVEGPDYDSLFVSGGEPVESVVGPEDPMCILFTGGTTGFSKGVVLAHRSAIYNAASEMIDTGMAGHTENVGLNLTPIFHSAALLCVFVPHYISGGTNVLLRKFDEKQIAEVVEAERVTTSFMIPNMIRRLLRAGVLETPGFEQYFRQMHSGGGLLRMPDKEAIAALLPDVRLFFRYGLTEAGPMVARALPDDVMNPALDGTIGQEYTFVEVSIRDFDGEEVPSGELGEIWVRGPSVMIGYYNKPQETTDALAHGWLHTGDLAVRDEDGLIFFRDRAKDMIKSGGENVYAAEIEQQLYAHPAVMECGVLGVPSTEWDEEVRAVVALRAGSTVTEDELKTYLRGHLAGYKIPKTFKFISSDEMPVNPSGKIVKSRLRSIVKW